MLLYHKIAEERTGHYLAAYRPPVQAKNMMRDLLLNTRWILQLVLIYHGPSTCPYYYLDVLSTARICAWSKAASSHATNQRWILSGKQCFQPHGLLLESSWEALFWTKSTLIYICLTSQGTELDLPHVPSCNSRTCSLPRLHLLWCNEDLLSLHVKHILLIRNVQRNVSRSLDEQFLKGFAHGKFQHLQTLSCLGITANAEILNLPIRLKFLLKFYLSSNLFSPEKWEERPLLGKLLATCDLKECSNCGSDSTPSHADGGIK